MPSLPPSHSSSLDAVAYTGAYYGEGLSEIVLDNVDCINSETTINQCFRTTTPNCIHTQDAGVACYPERKVHTHDKEETRSSVVSFCSTCIVLNTIQHCKQINRICLWLNSVNHLV